VAVLFGNEHSGLTNRELDECGLVLTIPSSPEFPSLNLAQSVMVVAYELARAAVKTPPLPLVESRESRKLFKRLPKTLQALGYGRAGDKDLPAEISRHLRRLCGRAGLTEWELNMLLGLCTQVDQKLGPKAARGPKRGTRPNRDY
jgi:tRNA C32,U32 (ribose-2'-O)-methylase TrmJ